MIHVDLAVIGFTLALTTTAAAQQHEHPTGDARGLGQLTFATSCVVEVQGDFNRAVAMLHSFWYQAAERAFEAVSARDPDCAMAYWGVAMSRFRQLWERPGAEDMAIGRVALEKAWAARETSDRELGYIGALEGIYLAADEMEHLGRLVAYEQAMEELATGYPDDSEATIFYALALLGTAYASPPDKTYDRQKRAGSILTASFAAQADHPGLAHYIIHSYDYPVLAQDALQAARRYAAIAPDAPHALHMPSHIFTRLGLWQESIDSNWAAAAAAHKDRWIGEELHATDYLVYAYLQGAQDGEARQIVEAVPKLRNELSEGDSNYFAGVFATAAIPARYAVERREWKEAAALDVPADVFPGGGACGAEATLAFARGLGAARLGQHAAARGSIADLERCREVLLRANEALWANRVEVQRRSVAAWLALAEGRNEEALAAMGSAADLEDSTDKPPATPGSIVPARELLGEMLLEVGHPAEASLAFRTALRDAPNRFWSLYGAARAAELNGDMEMASDWYAKLLEVCSRSDSERPELYKARSFLASAE